MSSKSPLVGEGWRWTYSDLWVLPVSMDGWFKSKSSR